MCRVNKLLFRCSVLHTKSETCRPHAHMCSRASQRVCRTLFEWRVKKKMFRVIRSPSLLLVFSGNISVRVGKLESSGCDEKKPFGPTRYPLLYIVVIVINVLQKLKCTFYHRVTTSASHKSKLLL